MKTLLFKIFIENWPRKLISLVLAVIIWMMVSQSMTVSKLIPNIPVRVINLPPDKTIEGMQINGTLSRKVSLTLIGHKTALDSVSARDLEIVIDAKDKSQEWIANIEKKNLVSLNPDLDIIKHISKVISTEMILRPSKLLTERIPITVTSPIGEVPKGYQFLDIYPSRLFVSVGGPEEAVKRLKSRGLKLTFDLNEIRQEDLDALKNSSKPDGDEISFLVPDAWKKISLPLLSENQIEIDDPLAKALRIDFSRQDLLQIGFSIPVTVFYPPKFSQTLNPDTYNLATNNFITKRNGIKIFSSPLYARGVSRLFLETVKDMVQMVIIAAPKSERDTLLWSAQFMYPHELEQRYVTKAIAESNEIIYDVQPDLLEDYLRTRFRNYMDRFRLYTPDNQKLSLKIELKSNSILVSPQNYP